MRELKSSYALHIEINSCHIIIHIYSHLSTYPRHTDMWLYHLCHIKLILNHIHVMVVSTWLCCWKHHVSTVYTSNFFVIECKLMQLYQFRDEQYRIYYPPRELAGYIPAYLALLFVFIPVIYMGLNIVYHDSDNIKWWTNDTIVNESKLQTNHTQQQMGSFDVVLLATYWYLGLLYIQSL